MNFLSGALTQSRRSTVDEHLGDCQACLQLVGAAARSSQWPDDEQWDRLRPTILTAGTLLAGRYTIDAFLGAGAMGEVHAATDSLSGEKIALKTLHPAATEHPKSVARLRSEVVLAHRVTHPNVCRVFDLGCDRGEGADGKGLFFLTMEYLPGPTLAAALTAEGPMMPVAALPILKQIATGLEAAHSVGVVHRDLKTSNVMLVTRPDGSRRAVITDFGLADSLGQGPASVISRAMFCGTPAYAAPEQLAGGRATPRSDVYSFGVLAFELLTGARPTGCLRCQESAEHEGHSAAEGPRLDVAVPAPLRAVVEKALQQNPDRRFADGAALAVALAETAMAAAPRRRAWLWPVGAVTVAAGLLLALFANRAHDKTRPVPIAAAGPAEPSRPAPAKDAAPIASATQAETPQPTTELTATGWRPTTNDSDRPHTVRKRRTLRPTTTTGRTVAGARAPESATRPDDPSDDLVRELRPVSGAPAAETNGHADLVDPFAARRRSSP